MPSRTTALRVRCAVLAVTGAALLIGGAAPRSAAERFALSAEARLVMIPITVTDRDGKSITNLQPEHFRVFDNSELRPVVSVAREDAPVSMGVVMDVSGSMADKLAQAISAVKAVTETAEPEDEAFLITFADRPEMSAGMTRDVKSVINGMAMARAGGATALIDAVYLALHKVKDGANRRKTLVVVSDGGDNNSRFEESELLARAMESDVQIYSISVHEHGLDKEERAGVFLLEKLSAVTGGLHFTIRNPKELPAVAEKIATAMRNVYVLSFKPPDALHPGKWRKVSVKLAVASPRSFRVAAKSGYYSPE
jgi:Ca-activated chloride channel homolog